MNSWVKCAVGTRLLLYVTNSFTCSYYSSTPCIGGPHLRFRHISIHCTKG